jgi:nucleotide-binding universal stress UspA family protein
MTFEINRNILIAVDESDNSHRAVTYVGKLIGGIEGFTVTVLHVISEPEEDYFNNVCDEDQWYNEYRQKVDRMLDNYRTILIDSGFNPENVSTRSTIRYCPSMAECILAEKDNTEYSTLVVGRRGLTYKEEFVLGSISGKIVRTAKNCTVWVVQ